MYGWTGKRLKVYLSEGKVIKEEIPEELRLEFWGGRGLNSKTLFDEVRPGIEPLSSENILMIGVGPLNGTSLPCNGRCTITAKSPLTGILGDTNVGGDFAAELKFAGYDQIIFYGQSPKPVYLWIKDEKVELRDASHLWGLTTRETHNQLAEELRDREIRDMCIGPAGENLVRFASIMVNTTRAAARCGMGAVMGSKKLKAVAVRGTGSVKIARPNEFSNSVKDIYDKLIASQAGQVLMEQGELYLTRLTSRGMLGTNNQQRGYFEGWENLTYEAFSSKYARNRSACFACPLHCGWFYEVREGPYTTHGEGVEFASLLPLTAKLGSDNLAAGLLRVSMCDQLGLDCISCGGTIAFAMEARERGLLTDKDCDYLDLKWGNADTIIQLLKKIAYREGFGNLLADGSRVASQKIPGSEICLVQVKGLEWIMFYPGIAAEKGRTLAIATSTRGADHLRGFMGALLKHHKIKEFGGDEMLKSIKNPQTYFGKGALCAIDNDYKAATDSLEICWLATNETEYGLLEPRDLAPALSAATGVQISGDDLLKVGERIYNVERAFNIREGLSRKDDKVPGRFLVEEIHGRPTAGVDPAKFQAMLDEYYEFRGWDEEGIPTRKKLEELNLGYIIEQIGLSSLRRRTIKKHLKSNLIR